MRMSKHPTEVIKAVGSEESFGALRSSDNETYSSRTPHARCIKAGKGKQLVYALKYATSEKICG